MNIIKAYRNRKRLISLGFVALFAIVGVTVLFISHAAVPYTSIEPETGTNTGTTVTADSKASAGSYVQFGTESTGSSGSCGPAPTGVTYQFDDEFCESALDTTKWTIAPDGCQLSNTACDKSTNVFLDGNGDLILRVERESGGYDGSNYSGAFVGTFNYSSGWPPTQTKAKLTLPVHLEMRAEYPGESAGWAGLWTMDINRNTSQGLAELDIGENRVTQPTIVGCHQHFWLNGSDTGPWDCAGESGVTNISQNFHVYAADIYSDKVVYYFDGQVIGQNTIGDPGQIGILLDSIMGDPGSWGADGGTPPTSGGPWNMTIDYIRAWSIAND